MMKNLLLSLFILSALPSQIWAKAMVTVDDTNALILAKTGKCSGCDLVRLDSSQLKVGALLNVSGTFVTVPSSPHPAITDLHGAFLNYAVFNCALDGLSLKGVDFGNATLSNATFNSCDLTGAKFNGATLIDTSFTGSTTLVNADFTSANLSGANLSGVNATGAIFTDAPMYKALLSCGNFTNTRFSGAGLSGSDIACSTPVTCTNGNCTGGTNFTNALFYDPATDRGLDESINQEAVAKDSSGNYVITLDPTKLNLSGMSLSNVTFNNANMVGIDLSQCSFTNCYFMGAQTNLSSANLTGATFSATSFKQANLINANLSYTKSNGVVDFTLANLTGTNFTSANLMGTNFTSAALRSVIVDNANFSNSAFTLAVLTVPKADSVVFDGSAMNNGIYLFGNLTNSSMQNISLVESAGFIWQYDDNLNATGTNIINSAYSPANVPLSTLLSRDNLRTDQRVQTTPPGTHACNHGPVWSTETTIKQHYPIWNVYKDGSDICNYIQDINYTGPTCPSLIASILANGTLYNTVSYSNPSCYQ